MSVKCVIFDIGDTLIDSDKSLERTKKLLPELKFLNKKGFMVSKRDFLKALPETVEEMRKTPFPLKHKYGLFAAVMLKNLGIRENKRLEIEMEDAFYSVRDRKTVLMPNARRILSWLGSNNITIIALSNVGTKPVMRRLRIIRLKQYFDKVFISEALGYEKSSVIPFKIALKWLKPKGIKATECLMVGNDYVEDASAKKAGIKTVILTVNASQKDKAAAKPDYEIKNLIELKRIIRGLNERK